MDRDTHSFCEPACDLLANAPADLAHALPDGLEGAALAVLDDDLDLAAAGADVRAEEVDDVDMLGAGRDRDLAQQLLHRGLERRDRLARHDRARAPVAHLVHRAARALAEAGEIFEVVVRPFVKLADGLPDVVHGDLL